MDQMMEQLQALAGRKKQLSEKEWQLVASYLVGQVPFEEAAALLPTSNDSYYRNSYSHVADILNACRETPQLLSRLGRHLRLLENRFPQAYTWIVAHLASNGMELTGVLLDTGLGPTYLLDYLFGRSATTGGERLELLDLLFREHREALEQYALTAPLPARLQPAAYLHARLPERERGKLPSLEEDCLLCYGACVKSQGEEALRRFEEALGKQDPGLQGLFRKGRIHKALKSLEQKRCFDYNHHALSALVLSQFELDYLNRIARAACEADYRHFLHLLVAVENRLYSPAYSFFIEGNRTGNLSLEEIEESIRSQLDLLEGWLDKAGIPRAFLCAWAMSQFQHKPLCWGRVYRERYGVNPGLLREAASLALPMERAGLLAFLHKLGEPVDPGVPREIIAHLLQTHLHPQQDPREVSAVEAWLLGQGPEDPADLPSLEAWFSKAEGYNMIRSPKCELDWAIWSFQGMSPIPARYLSYLAANRRHLHIEYAVLYLSLFHGLDREKIQSYLEGSLGIKAAILSLATRAIAGSRQPQALEAQLEDLIRTYPVQAGEAAREGEGAEVRLYLLDYLYGHRIATDADLLIDCLSDGSKKVRQAAVSYLMPRRELADRIRPLAEAKKKAVREAAESLMAAYEGGKEAGDPGDVDVLALCTRHLPKNAMASLKWAFSGEIPPVRWRESGEPADPAVPLCYLALVLGGKTMEPSPTVLRIREALHGGDLRAIGAQVFAQWLSDGAPAKNKGAILLFALHANNEEILLLQKQIDDWSVRSRGAIASDAVRAMALNGSGLALMTVDTISRKAKNRQVRRAGQEAFAAAAKALNTTPEALGDRIIPNLGFDQRGEKVVDYGPRQFTALLTPSLTVQVRDGSGKLLKSLPKPGAKDDPELAEAAKAEFAALKKSLKAVVATQGARLEQALATGRGWTRDAWIKLFVENPIMHSFATGLVWGLYREGSPPETFRYMEDGSFTTVDEDEFQLPGEQGEGECIIRLVHPLDLEEGELEAWKEQLSDYEITQPILQLDRPVYRLEGSERDAMALDRFGGKIMLGITLLGKLQKAGWYKGSVQDAGVFYTFYKETGETGVQLYFGGMYVSPDPGDKITLGQAAFYRAGSVDRGSYVYDDVTRETCIPLAQVPPRLFSETVYELTLATASAAESDGNWNKDNGLLFFGGK